MQLADEKALDYWMQRVSEWKESIHEKLNEFNAAEAGNFYTLGLFKVELAASTKILNDRHQQVLRNLIRRMEILKEIRDRWIKP